MMKTKAIQAEAGEIARVGILTFGDAWADEMERISPVSTGRFLRAFQQAMVQAGGKPRSLYTIRPNKRRDDLIAGLQDLIARRQDKLARARATEDKLNRFFLKRNPPRVPTSPWAVRAQAFVKEIPKLEADVRKMTESLAALMDQPSAIVMGVLLGNNLNPERGRRVVYVRGLVGKKGLYGGTGELIRARLGRAILRLTNREPHSKIVNWRTNVVDKATVIAKTESIVTSRSLIRKMLKGLVNNPSPKGLARNA